MSASGSRADIRLCSTSPRGSTGRRTYAPFRQQKGRLCGFSLSSSHFPVSVKEKSVSGSHLSAPVSAGKFPVPGAGMDDNASWKWHCQFGMGSALIRFIGPERRMAVDAERHQVTVLFTDMVGFTAFSETAGEEAAFRLMRDVARLTGDVVREQGGAIQNFTGDGLMAVFGAPVAFEDAPVRACRAALGIIGRLERAADEFEREYGTRPQWRIGINSGSAVVGEVQDGGVTVMGDVVNIAARLQSIAEPGTAYLTETTRRLAEGRIESGPKGNHQIKGRAGTMQVFKLERLLPDASRFASAVQRGLSPFVGREKELEILERNLEEARHGLRVVDIVAEPGMGKS